MRDQPGTSTGGYTQQGSAQCLSTLNAENTNTEHECSSPASSEVSDSSNSSIGNLLRQRKRLSEKQKDANVQADDANAQVDDPQPPAKVPRYGVRFNWPTYPEAVFNSREECDNFIKGIFFNFKSRRKNRCAYIVFIIVIR